jgi:DNA repair exonuclease SbcCD nuclease subunit
VSDYQDVLANIQKQQSYQDTMSFKREQEVNKNATNAQKLDIERQKLQTQKEIADKQLQIAKENKNKYDVGAKKKK